MTRKRRFHYELQYQEGENIDFLKSIECKQHIFGFDESVIKGMIYFANNVTEYRIKILFQYKEFILVNTDFTVEDYRCMQSYWEKGKGDTKRQKSGSLETVVINLLEMQKELCDHLMKQNQKLMEQNQSLIDKNCLLENSLKTALTNTMTNSHNKIENHNSHNKSFNINLFLNEDCKNAVTLAEFVKKIVINDDDLFYAKDNGLAEAITNVFERELQNYDLTTRPVHCTDVKRETMHIKAEEGWVKEAGEESKHMKKAIHNMSIKNLSKMKNYFEENPNYKNVQNPDYDDSIKMMRQIIGADDSPEKTEKRVLKNISKKVFLENKL